MELGVMTYDKILRRIGQVAKMIYQNEEKLLVVLKCTETYKTAKTEIEKSLFCLQNINKQVEYLSNDPLPSLCVFLPLNQPLYSLILFVVIPGCKFKRTFFRPPVLLQATYKELYELLGLRQFEVYCDNVSRREFLTRRVSYADAVIYTGKYENSQEVMQLIPQDAIYIYQGSATNPIVITESATITDELIEKVVLAQTYNSGQDCMAPAAILVAKKHWDDFLNRLKARLSLLEIGTYDCLNADISSVIEAKTMDNAGCLIQDGKAKLLYGGKIDRGKKLIYPTILQFDHVSELPYASSFAPIFSLYCYYSEKEVVAYLSRLECQENRAYVSIFGQLSQGLNDEIIIKDDILDSVDNGYSEFGGYGIRSGYIAYNNLIKAHPILISKELSEFTINKCNFLHDYRVKSPYPKMAEAATAQTSRGKS